MIHKPSLVTEVRELPPEGGWARYEHTGRACVVCPCGLNTGWVVQRHAGALYTAHPRSTPRRHPDSTTKGTAVFATLLWLVVLAAAADLLLNDNPTAINGVLGAGAAALILTTATVALWRQDQRL